MNREISLNGPWQFQTDPQKSGLQNGFAKGLPDAAKTVTVPNTWNIQKGLENYAGLAWYGRSLKVPAAWKGKAVFIRFAAVYHDAVIYINGKRVGEHLNSGYTAFTFDISPFLTYGQQNKLTLSCDNSFSATNLPFQTAFDWVNDGGIIRDVTVYICDRPSVKYVHVTPDLQLKDSSANILVKVKLNETEVTSTTISATLKERKSRKVLTTKKVTLTRDGDTFQFSIQLKKVTPWHFDNPFLYELQVTTSNAKGIADVRTEKFGFKKVALNGEKLTLNGEEVRLPGIEYMAGSHPAFGSAEPRKIMDSVARMMKQLNVVITRFHWQQDDYLLDLMDEYGILVQEEIPWWQRPAQLTPEVMATAKQQLTEMTEAHYNHPSIYAWALNNEVPSTQQDNDQLKAFTRALDGTRLINVVGNKMDQKLAKDPGLMGDLPAWNDYVGTWNGNQRDVLPKKLDEIHPALNGRPLFISEAGLCEPAFSGGDARRIDDMHYHINEWRKKPFIAGFIYFCLNDYRTQMGEEGKGKFQIRRHGITNIYLKPKPSYYTFAQLCSPVEVTKVVRVNSSDILVEIQVKNSIPSYTIRNYLLEYRDANGKLHQVSIDELKPGQTRKFTITHINERYSFAIKRPGGTVVASY
ncbi:MAG: sugar-binding domain-containing protein [Bacteroidota bacterium]